MKTCARVFYTWTLCTIQWLPSNTRRARFSQLLRTSNPEKCFDATYEAPKTPR